MNCTSYTFRMVSNLLFTLILTIGLSACTTGPYRTAMSCDTSLDKEAKELCSNKLIKEVTGDYQLHFVEFDSQGWLHQNDGVEQKNTGEASKQLNALMHNLYQQADSSKAKELSVVIFAHGWHHNAKSDDSNVQDFRNLLVKIKMSRPNSDVIGIYVGWEGESVNIPIVKELTFWDRKSTALHVAEGSTRELFGRVREFQKTTNKKRGNHWVKTLFIGHSFGAKVVYMSISDQLIASLSGLKDKLVYESKSANVSLQQSPNSISITKQNLQGLERPADMVLLINPAFEAARFKPLFEAANGIGIKYAEYVPPMLVIATSTADWATKYAFPAGRIFNSIFERPTNSEEQSYAISRTPGFMDQYVSHDLTVLKEANAGCNYNSVDDFAKDNRDFEMPLRKWKDGWKRNYCSGNGTNDGLVLQHRLSNDDMAKGRRNIEANSPIWNILTTKDVMKDHNEINKQVFINFIQQTYGDLMLFE